MNVLKQCCYRSMKENRKRTIVTVIGIILAASLITAVACMAESFHASLIEYEKKANGDFHYSFEGVRPENLKYFENNKNIERIGLAGEVGYAFLEGSKNEDKPYVYIRALDEEGEKSLSLQLVQGRMPENDTELVIGRHIRTNGQVDLKVGDVLTLQIGDRMSDGYKLNQNNPYSQDQETLEIAFEKMYTIVGIIERPNQGVENRMAPGYSVFTYMEDASAAGILEVYTIYTNWGLRHAEQVTAGILGVSEDLYDRYYNISYNYTAEEEQQIKQVAECVYRNEWLLKWMLLRFSSGTLNMLYAMSAIAIVIIIVTGVFCIRNSFVISLTEKMKLYGRLASVGTTSKQQKKIVYYEAAALGMTGIPLGIICGVAATWILVRLVGGLVEDAVDIGLVFDVSIPAILLAIVLSALTIFLSASKSARRAAKLSPISAIRASDTVKLDKKGLHCPKFVGYIFGIGGVIAYKNLRRAKVKYRTTVISIVISVAVFIGMTTFVQILGYATGIYYDNYSYQLRVSYWPVQEEDYQKAYEMALQVAELDGIQESEIVRTAQFWIDGDQITYTQEYLMDSGIEQNGRNYINMLSLGEDAYARFCKSVGVSAAEAADKAIVLADYHMTSWENGKVYVREGDIAKFIAGDVISGNTRADGGGIEMKIEVITQTKESPMAMKSMDYSTITLVVSDAWMDNYADFSKYITQYITHYIKCEDADQIEEIIRNEMELGHYTVTNYSASYKSEKSTFLVIAIFLYGFITVVALIGITNIFNTITTNMELRAPEFAMLKSMGMTGREFKRMIWLEGMFYGGKALLIGIPLGILLSAGFNRALNEGIVAGVIFPWRGIFISIIAVAVLLFGIMRYSMGKINRKNIIETIQNENI